MIDKPAGAHPNPFFKKFSASLSMPQLAARGLVGAAGVTAFALAWLPRDPQEQAFASTDVSYVTLPRVEIVGRREHAPAVVAQAGKAMASHD